MNEVVSSVSESPLKPAASGAEQLKQSIAFESFFLKVNDVISVFNSRHLNLIRVLRAEAKLQDSFFKCGMIIKLTRYAIAGAAASLILLLVSKLHLTRASFLLWRSPEEK